MKRWENFGVAAVIFLLGIAFLFSGVSLADWKDQALQEYQVTVEDMSQIISGMEENYHSTVNDLEREIERLCQRRDSLTAELVRLEKEKEGAEQKFQRDISFLGEKNEELGYIIETLKERVDKDKITERELRAEVNRLQELGLEKDQALENALREYLEAMSSGDQKAKNLRERLTAAQLSLEEEKETLDRVVSDFFSETGRLRERIDFLKTELKKKQNEFWQLAKEKNGQIAELENEVGSLENRIESLNKFWQKEVHKLQGEVYVLQQENQELKSAIERTTREYLSAMKEKGRRIENLLAANELQRKIISNLSVDNAQATAGLTKLRGQIGQLQKANQAQEEAIAKLQKEVAPRDFNIILAYRPALSLGGEEAARVSDGRVFSLASGGSGFSLGVGFPFLGGRGRFGFSSANLKDEEGLTLGGVNADYLPYIEVWDHQFYSAHITVEGNDLQFYPQEASLGFGAEREVSLTDYSLGYYHPFGAFLAGLQVGGCSLDLSERLTLEGGFFEREGENPAYVNNWEMFSEANSQFSGFGYGIGAVFPLEFDNSFSFQFAGQLDWYSGKLSEEGYFEESHQGYMANQEWEFTSESNYSQKRNLNPQRTRLEFLAGYQITSHIEVIAGYQFENWSGFPSVPKFGYGEQEDYSWHESSTGNDSNSGFSLRIRGSF